MHTDKTDHKDEQVRDLLSWLRSRFGQGFAVVDHWEADLLAIGISAVGDPRQLVYIACHRSGEYFVELETAPAAGAELPYATAGRFEAVDRETLLGIIARHLSLEVHEKRRRSG